MTLQIQLGEEFGDDRYRLTVTPTAYAVLPRVREYLIDVARSGATVSYGRLRSDLELPYVPSGMGRLLALLSVDCELRGEPTLAAVVVNSTTGEVGGDFRHRAPAIRQELYAHWTRTTD